MANVIREIDEVLTSEGYTPDDIAWIAISLQIHDQPNKRISTTKWYEFFMLFVTVEYDDGYGSQELFGEIMMNDGTWFERYEYDGSEYWRHAVPPTMPSF